MILGLAALFFLAVALAWGNGSNDVSKGIATLVGSGVTSERTAVAWGSAWTTLGGLAAAFAAQGLVATFSGGGFLAAPPQGSSFLASVAIGATAWILFASRAGLPVSTTHAIVGALAGTAIAAQGAAALHWAHLATKAALPMAVSPLVSIGLLYALFPLLSRRLARVETYCVCLERRAALVSAGSGLLAFTVSETTVVAPEDGCARSPAVAGRLNVLRGLHWLSSAATSFARGLNDAPKIVALGLVASAGLGIPGAAFYAVVALAMGGGSLVAGIRVTRTLACRVTRMSPAEGFSANLVTTLLVGAASLAALPVSTTHVSSSAIIGIGLHRGVGAVDRRTVNDILLAWLVTLPVAGLVGAGAYVLIGA